jgi:hypothetical protein
MDDTLKLIFKGLKEMPEEEFQRRLSKARDSDVTKIMEFVLFENEKNSES